MILELTQTCMKALFKAGESKSSNHRPFLLIFISFQ